MINYFSQRGLGTLPAFRSSIPLGMEVTLTHWGRGWDRTEMVPKWEREQGWESVCHKSPGLVIWAEVESGKLGSAVCQRSVSDLSRTKELVGRGGCSWRIGSTMKTDAGGASLTPQKAETQVDLGA